MTNKSAEYYQMIRDAISEKDFAEVIEPIKAKYSFEGLKLAVRHMREEQELHDAEFGEVRRTLEGIISQKPDPSPA